MPKRRYVLLLVLPLMFAMLPLAGLFAFNGSADLNDGDGARTATAVTDLAARPNDDALAMGTVPCDRPFSGGLADS